ncbi:carboxymuconolactone decarboxylase family protein [Marinobacterium jannaschii]|uniref:carboxymuconolactone decarboxylase family protein n=1 Tax=Marinobacterium jannaschii TaxID=64970 RepID=UPI0004850AD3|nr:carboxymuconolactone decarboxylase family protein [Marinobacterium jannaschii]
MSKRLDYHTQSPEAIQAMMGLEKYLAQCQLKGTLEKSLLHLIKLRVSQINGCAYCIDMHTREARKDGETEQRLYCLSVWRECPFYSDKEQAALAWAEANTLIASTEISDQLFLQTRQQFSETALVDLTLAIVTINSWNRIAISFKDHAMLEAAD